ncbi:MAG: hypothetical protein K5857_04945 [Lachnospiraceae bacterium]|nr:hypothetical protein [Lachnospiraceae bacterium]
MIRFTEAEKAENPKITITGKGNYSGIIKDAPVTIITQAEKREKTIRVTLSNTSNIVYNGKPQTLTESQLVVKDGNNKVVPSGKYSVSYMNNINSGTAKVIVTGIGGYTGSETRTFRIAPDRNISNLAVRAYSSSVPYTSTGARPKLAVTPAVFSKTQVKACYDLHKSYRKNFGQAVKEQVPDLQDRNLELREFITAH